MKSLFTVLRTVRRKRSLQCYRTMSGRSSPVQKNRACRRWIFNRSEHRYNLGWIRSERRVSLSPTFSLLPSLSPLFVFQSISSLASDHVRNKRERKRWKSISESISGRGNVNGHEHSVIHLSIVLTVPVSFGPLYA